MKTACKFLDLLAEILLIVFFAAIIVALILGIKKSDNQPEIPVDSLKTVVQKTDRSFGR
jgi:uncharacterized membrane protein YvbJ